jgi:vancomycin resistance protein VanW
MIIALRGRGVRNRGNGSRVMTDTMTATLASASRTSLAARRTKVAYFQARRLLTWTLQRDRWRVPALAASPAEFPHRVYEREVPIGRTDPGADPVLEQGKRVNLALAAPCFDGLVLAPEQPLSFWRALGRVTAARGFRHGMELRGGCIVPALGGGLCALSNALFRMACELGWNILERHGHTRDAAPLSAAPLSGDLWGLDATVFWPHVDLRIAPGQGQARLGLVVVGDRLLLRVDATVPLHTRVSLAGADDRVDAAGRVRIRHNRVLRVVVDQVTGREVQRDVVAVNRKELVRVVDQRRNCMTCDEEACHARPRSLPRSQPSHP